MRYSIYMLDMKLILFASYILLYIAACQNMSNTWEKMDICSFRQNFLAKCLIFKTI